MGSVAVVIALCLGGIGAAIKSDEEVIFFPTFGHRDRDRATWNLHVHGWIYEPVPDNRRLRTLLEPFARSLGLEEQAAQLARFQDRAWPFLADNERGKTVHIRLGGNVYPAGRSEANGHFQGTVRLSAAEVQDARRLPDKDGWLGFQAVVREDDRRRFEGEVLLLGAEGLSVVSTKGVELV
jgi:hypothetical protein